MALKYDLYQNVNSLESDAPSYHARPVKNSVCTEKELYRHVSHHIKFNPQEVEALMSAVGDVLVEMLSEGRTVRLGSLGSLQVTLSCPEAHAVSDVRAGNVEVNSVSFRPKKTFLDDIRRATKLERERYKNHSANIGMEEIRRLTAEYLAENKVMKRKDFKAFTGLTDSTSVNRLRQLVEEGFIESISKDPRHPLYVLV